MWLRNFAFVRVLAASWFLLPNGRWIAGEWLRGAASGAFFAFPHIMADFGEPYYRRTRNAGLHNE